MAESLTACMDCLDAMRSFPDKFFDLAVVDPPYGDGRSQSGNVERERESWSRFGERFGRYTYPPNDTRTQQTDGEKVSVHRTGGGWAAKLDPGKKHNVGRSAGAGLFRGAVSRLTKPDHLGRKLFRPSSDKVLSGLAQVANPT